MYVQPEPSDTAPSCFWIQLWRRVAPGAPLFTLLWQSEVCVAPDQTYEYMVVIITDIVLVSFIGFTIGYLIYTCLDVYYINVLNINLSTYTYFFI